MSVPYDFYDYTAYWQGRHFEDQCERIALDKLFGLFDKHDSLLDVGGGFGRLASFYSPLFKSCFILEPSEKLIEIGKKNLKNYSNIVFKKGCLPTLPFKDGSFDVTLMVRVLHHFESSFQPIKEVSRVLKPGGYFILEIANKVHFLARFKAFLKGDFSFSSNLEPFDRRSQTNIEEKKITFVNHHPKKVISDLEQSGFSIIKIFSVSNLRHQFLKKIVPERILLFIENMLQGPFGKIFFGPSIFILARKNP